LETWRFVLIASHCQTTAKNTEERCKIVILWSCSDVCQSSYM
jgi:hypothetical protein